MSNLRYRDHGDRADLAICGDCSTRSTLSVVSRDEINEHNNWHTAATLFDAWQTTRAAYEQSDTDRNYTAEQTAHDALVDYIEAHDLNDSELDPRTDKPERKLP